MSKANVEYVGFRDIDGRREYHLRSRSGADREDYTIAIAHEAFASGQARYQDGPEICYQKLQRELEAPNEPDKHELDVTSAELAEYRTLHAPARKRWTAPGPSPAAAMAGGVAAGAGPQQKEDQ